MPGDGDIYCVDSLHHDTSRPGLLPSCREASLEAINKIPIQSGICTFDVYYTTIFELSFPVFRREIISYMRPVSRHSALCRCNAIDLKQKK